MDTVPYACATSRLQFWEAFQYMGWLVALGRYVMDGVPEVAGRMSLHTVFVAGESFAYCFLYIRACGAEGLLRKMGCGSARLFSDAVAGRCLSNGARTPVQV